MNTPTTTRLRVWDVPTRLFHWLLAASIVAMVITAKIGGNAMEWHLRLGHVVLGLLIFRVLWGLKGGYWSRFATFIPSPARLVRYLRGQGTPSDHTGHTPLGALSVVAMLGIVGLQVGTGLVSDDEIAFAGSLVQQVSGDTVAWATVWHKGWGQWLLLGLLGLHVLAIAYYSVVRRAPLVAAMVHGNQPSPAPALPASADGPGQWLVASIFAFASAIMAYWVWTQGLISSY